MIRPALAALIAAIALTSCSRSTGVPVAGAAASRPATPMTSYNAPPIPNAPTSIDQLAFVLGQWAGTDHEGGPAHLGFRRTVDNTIIVREGDPAADWRQDRLEILEHDGEIVAHDRLMGYIPHVGSMPMRVRQFEPNLVGFASIWGVRWHRTEDLLVETRFYAGAEPGGVISRTSHLRRVPAPPPPDRSAESLLRALLSWSHPHGPGANLRATGAEPQRFRWGELTDLRVPPFAPAWDVVSYATQKANNRPHEFVIRTGAPRTLREGEGTPELVSDPVVIDEIALFQGVLADGTMRTYALGWHRGRWMPIAVMFAPPARSPG